MDLRRFLLPLVCAAALRPAPAAAQARSVDDLLRDGVQQRLEHRDADAFASFSAAWEQCRCAEARVQMALAAQALGRWCDALGLLDGALAAPGDPFIAQHRAALDEERRAIASHTGTVRVEVDPPAARIALDGAPIAPAPAAHCAPVGEHALTVTAPGRVPLARSLAVEPDARVDLGLALTLLSPPRPPAPRAGSPSAPASSASPGPSPPPSSRPTTSPAGTTPPASPTASPARRTATPSSPPPTRPTRSRWPATSPREPSPQAPRRSGCSPVGGR